MLVRLAYLLYCWLYIACVLVAYVIGGLVVLYFGITIISFLLFGV